MQWKPEYSIDIKEIDDQHKGLIAKFSEVEKIIAAEHTWLDVHYALVQLSQLARRHFEFEEALMRLFGIPDVEGHQRAHEHFFTKMAEIEGKALKGSAESELLKFLYEWLREHILIADRRDYGAFVSSIAQVVKAKADPVVAN